MNADMHVSRERERLFVRAALLAIDPVQTIGSPEAADEYEGLVAIAHAILRQTGGDADQAAVVVARVLQRDWGYDGDAAVTGRLADLLRRAWSAAHHFEV